MKKSGIAFIFAVICSLAMGVTVYFMTAFFQWTLVLDAKTFKAATGTVAINGENGAAPTIRHFDIENTEGSANGIVIGLPAIRITSVTVLPLAPPGQFEVGKIALSNDAINFTWDEQLNGSVRKTVNGQAGREACGDGCPGITTAPDGSITITSIPDIGTSRPTGDRIARALATALLLLLGAVWILRPPREPVENPFVGYYGPRMAWMLFFGIYACQFWAICRFAVDVPYHDEWLYFLPDNLSHDFSPSWIFSHFLEHRIAPTKLLAWLNLELFGLDFRLQKIINYLIFGLMLATVVVLKNAVAGKKAFPYFPLFLIFLLSPISWENHRWGFQSQIHFVLLFSNLALATLYRTDRSKSFLVFLMLANAAMYSFAAGVILAVVGSLFYLIRTCASIYSGKTAPRAGWRNLLIGYAVLACTLALWFYAYRKPDHPLWSQPFYIYPTEPDFWGYFLNQLSYFFGSNDLYGIYGLICLLLVLLPAVLLMKRAETRQTSSVWTIVTAIAFILAVLVSISMSRTYINAEGPKTSRYVEIGALLIPYAALAWWLLLRSSPRRLTALALFWLFCIGGYFDRWSPEIYRKAKMVDEFHLDCVERYFNGTGDGVCQVVSTPQILDRAQRLGAKFTRRFIQSREAPPAAGIR